MTAGPEPLLSVVVPTHRRPEALGRCLEALCDQDYPQDRFSVIVVDDGSPSPPSQVIARFGHRLPLEFLRQPRAGPAAARNAGAGRARGELLVFTDDDCTAETGWLRAFAAAHAETPDAALGGCTVNGLPANRYSAASQMLLDYLYGYFNGDPASASFVASNNLAMPARGFREIGGFDSGFPRAAGEDRELCDRWVSRGRTIRYVPAAKAEHHHVLTLGGFLRQHLNYGRGAFEFQRVRAQRGAATPIEPLRFYLRLLVYPFSRLGPRRALAASGLLLLAQVVNAAGFFWERCRGAPAPRSTRKA